MLGRVVRLPRVIFALYCQNYLCVCKQLLNRYIHDDCYVFHEKYAKNSVILSWKKEVYGVNFITIQWCFSLC